MDDIWVASRLIHWRLALSYHWALKGWRQADLGIATDFEMWTQNGAGYKNSDTSAKYTRMLLL
jgi:hypothetical protein